MRNLEKKVTVTVWGVVPSDSFHQQFEWDSSALRVDATYRAKFIVKPWSIYYSHTTPIRIPKDMGMVWE